MGHAASICSAGICIRSKNDDVHGDTRIGHRPVKTRKHERSESHSEQQDPPPGPVQEKSESSPQKAGRDDGPEQTHKTNPARAEIPLTAQQGRLIRELRNWASLRYTTIPNR